MSKLKEQPKKITVNHRTIDNPGTMWDGKGYDDREFNDQPSMTDPSAYMPTNEMITRILRGEKVPSGNFGRYDIDEKAKGNSDQLIEDYSDPTDNPGFDLSDLPELRKREAEIRSRIKSIEKKQQEIRNRKKAEADHVQDSNETRIDRSPGSAADPGERNPKDPELSNRAVNSAKKSS